MEIAAAEWMPHETHLVRLRVRTSGVLEQQIHMKADSEAQFLSLIAVGHD